MKKFRGACTKRSSNCEGRMLFLTCGPYALLRFPQFCLREIPVFGYAYAVLTRSLWIRFCAQTCSGSLRTRLFREQCFNIRHLFSLRNAAHGEGLHISSKHSRFFQLMGQQFVSGILFLQLTEGVDAFVLWCYTSTALRDNIFHYAGFSLGGIVGK